MDGRFAPRKSVREKMVCTANVYTHEIFFFPFSLVLFLNLINHPHTHHYISVPPYPVRIYLVLYNNVPYNLINRSFIDKGIINMILLFPSHQKHYVVYRLCLFKVCRRQLLSKVVLPGLKRSWWAVACWSLPRCLGELSAASRRPGQTPAVSCALCGGKKWWRTSPNPIVTAKSTGQDPYRRWFRYCSSRYTLRALPPR